MIGKILVIVTTVFSLISMLFYLLSYLNRLKNITQSTKYSNFGNYSYTGVVVGVLSICLFLLSNIVAHNFQYTYIWEYSSRELPVNLLIATFYAGQQGSILLWGLMITLIGYFILPYLKKHNYEAPVMMIYTSILAFILIMLIFKSPFDYVWETYGAEGVKEGFIPKNGRGLNPILQNYWISIHPPILFLGYSLMTIPYVFALAGLLLKDYRKWITLSLPWALFGSGVLGLGLMLGGFWAYETLGWGGFWAWDPVENSSLMPWLIAVSLVHTMLVNKKTGGLIKLNYILASLTFIFVLYASFLTRSGILGDTSVHSFVSPGPVIYKLLLVFLITYFVASLGVLIYRIKNIPFNSSDVEITSKEFMMTIGSILILGIFFVVFMGTSWPIITEIIGITKSSVDPSWYNKINLPLAVILMILNSFSLYLLWKRTDYTLFLKRFLLIAISSLIITVVLFSLGVNKIEFLLLVFASFLGLFANLDFLFKSFKFGIKTSGAFLSHSGLALFLLGALASGGYSVNETVRLNENETKSVLGFKITHKGKFQIDKHWTDREKFKYKILIEKDNMSKMVYPVVYFSDFNERKSPFFEPGIATTLDKDIYVSPYSLENIFPEPPIILQKTQSQKIALDTNFSIKLLKFDMSNAMSGGDGKTIKLASVVRLSDNKKYVSEDTLYNIMDPASGMSVPIWKDLPNSNLEIGFIRLVPNKEELSLSQAIFVAKPKGQQLSRPIETFVFDVSTKPFILVVWIGTIIIVLGFFLSILKYIGQSYKRTEYIDNIKENKLVKNEFKEAVVIRESN